MTLTRISLLALALGTFAGGCDLEPDVGAPIADRCSDSDTDPSTAVSFSEHIVPLILREHGGCTPCHNPTSSGSVGFQTAGFDITSYAALLRGGFNSSRTIVVPGRPCDSVLYLKVSPGPPFGSRMPLDGPPFLSGLELRLFHDWIAEGAKDD